MQQRTFSAGYLPGIGDSKAKKPYTMPTVKRFGDLRELAQAGSGPKNESPTKPEDPGMQVRS
jgi:hypothetical protein